MDKVIGEAWVGGRDFKRLMPRSAKRSSEPVSGKG